MERLKERLAVAEKVLQTLQDLAGENYSQLLRDASIQRFEYSFDATWKVAKHYLKEIEGLDENSPKGVIRACFQLGLLNQAQTQQALMMTDDRNLTSHTYQETLAIEIYSRIQAHQQLMKEWLQLVKMKLL
jgi:nucleotidyltransferase substrate binding protein (TIGR01987 family)